MLGVVLAQMYDNDNMNGWGWGALAMMVLIVALIVFIVWAFIWETRRTGERLGRHPHERAREILAERLARGDITPEEYRELSGHL